MNEPMAEVKSCGFLIYRRESNVTKTPTANEKPKRSFLLMRHPKRMDLPKGHVDPGENELECALRELEEETGIAQGDIELDSNFRFVQHYTVRYKKSGKVPKRKELVIFLAELTKHVEIQLTEHEGFEWVDWDPPHDIQEKTINPLLRFLADYWRENV